MTFLRDCNLFAKPTTTKLWNPRGWFSDHLAGERGPVTIGSIDQHNEEQLAVAEDFSDANNTLSSPQLCFFVVEKLTLQIF